MQWFESENVHTFPGKDKRDDPDEVSSCSEGEQMENGENEEGGGENGDGEDDKGPSINDVTQIFGVFGPASSFVKHSRNLSVLFVMLWVTPLPPRA